MNNTFSNHGAPYSSEYINLIVSETREPNMVHSRNTDMFNYYYESLLNDVLARFEWNLPDGWDFTFFIYTLYLWGFVGVYRTPKFGTVCDRVGLTALGFNYQPTELVIANPLLSGKDSYNRKIGIDGALIKLRPDYRGVSALVSYYADQMAIITEAALVNAFNSKQPEIFLSKNKQQAEALKRMYDDIATGIPAVFPDRRLIDAEGNPTVMQLHSTAGANYLVGKLLNDLATVRNNFYTEIGINNANTAKRERLITDEVKANNEAVESKLMLWYDSIRRGIDQVKKVFGDIGIDCRIRKEVTDDARDAIPAGSVSD